MKRVFIFKDIIFEIGNFTPRNNDFERGVKYRLFVNNIPTEHVFKSLKDCRSWIKENYFVYL